MSPFAQVTFRRCNLTNEDHLPDIQNFCRHLLDTLRESASEEAVTRAQRLALEARDIAGLQDQTPVEYAADVVFTELERLFDEGKGIVLTLKDLKAADLLCLLLLATQANQAIDTESPTWLMTERLNPAQTELIRYILAVIPQSFEPAARNIQFHIHSICYASILMPKEVDDLLAEIGLTTA